MDTICAARGGGGAFFLSFLLALARFEWFLSEKCGGGTPLLKAVDSFRPCNLRVFVGCWLLVHGDETALCCHRDAELHYCCST